MLMFDVTLDYSKYYKTTRQWIKYMPLTDMLPDIFFKLFSLKKKVFI